MSRSNLPASRWLLRALDSMDKRHVNERAEPTPETTKIGLWADPLSRLHTRKAQPGAQRQRNQAKHGYDEKCITAHSLVQNTGGQGE